MKIKEGFELRPVGDEFVVITIGDAMKNFNGMIKLNNTGVFIWKQLEKGIELDELIEAYKDQFSVDKEKAQQAVKNFISDIEQTNCFEDKI